MGSIAAARIEVFKRARAMLSMRDRAAAEPPVPQLYHAEVETALQSGLIMTPAQDLAFFARSTVWRCTGCGKVHSFDQRVSVALASPCACASIEFEPQHDEVFAGSPTLGQSLPELLSQ